ncbi:cell division control protein [Pelomyxa schiedti]|nr:cell division control protein [Pelomyxa schiedti]
MATDTASSGSVEATIVGVTVKIMTPESRGGMHVRLVRTVEVSLNTSDTPDVVQKTVESKFTSTSKTVFPRGSVVFLKQNPTNEDEYTKVLTTPFATVESSGIKGGDVLVLTQLFKVVCIGDKVADKTALLVTYAQNGYPTEYVPTVFDNYSGVIIVDGIPFIIGLWDTAGEEEHARLRPLSYPGTDVFIMCFSLGDPKSLHNITARWNPEITHHVHNAARILVANGCEIRDDTTKSIEISSDEINAVAKKVKAFAVVECSAVKNLRVRDVMEQAVRAAISRQDKDGCNIC